MTLVYSYLVSIFDVLHSYSEISHLNYPVFALTTILFKHSISVRAYGDIARFLNIPPGKTLKAPMIQFTQKPYC